MYPPFPLLFKNKYWKLWEKELLHKNVPNIPDKQYVVHLEVQSKLQIMLNTPEVENEATISAPPVYNRGVFF